MIRLKNISKLLFVAGCVSLLATNMANAAPLEYDLGTPDVRTDYDVRDKIILEGDINFVDNGQKINLSLRNTDVQQVLRMFADKAGLNIVFHESAKGKVTLDLVDVSLEDAFKMVMKMCGLTYVIKDKTLLIVSTNSSENLNLSKDNITIIPVKYADAAYIAYFLNTNVFSLNTPGLSFGPIVTTNADKNELLIFGTENDYLLAKKIVDKFDKKPTMTTYRVNHTTPFEMAKMICETLFQLPFTGSLSKEGSTSGSYKAKLNAEFQMKTAPDKSTSDTLSLGGGMVACTLKSSVSTTNLDSYRAKPTLIIYVQPELGTLTMVGGSEQQVQMVNDFIIENDRKQPQAYLELSIVALTEDGSRTFNNDWVLNGKHINVNFTGGETNTSQYMWHGPSNGQGARMLGQTISYLIENNKARMLANPKIVITNGKKSTIDLTQDYIASTTVQILSNTTIGIMSNSSVQKTYNVAKDNGIKFELTPFISPDGYVSLNLKPNYASIYREITDEYEGVPYTAATLLQRHNLDLSNVRIKDEETLLLGGMIQQEDSSYTGKFPLLGDIPVLGFFFRNQNKHTRKEELLIMITPRIIKDTEDVAEL